MLKTAWGAIGNWFRERAPERHRLWRTALLIAGTIAGLVVVWVRMLPREVNLGVAGLLFVLLIIWPLRFGYLGAALSFVWLISGSFYTTRAWLMGRDPFYLSIAVFQFATSASAIIIARLVERDRRRHRELERAAIVDGLTGLYNHKHFVRRIQQELARRARTDENIALMYIDLDNFKPINDTYGHQRGDVYLRRFSDLLLETVRADDTAYRLGGDEFAVILPSTGESGARAVAERLKEGMASDDLGLPAAAIRPSASVGISIAPEFADNADELMTQADSALYHAKHAGRDQIRLFQDVFNDILHYFSSGSKALIWSLKSLLWSAAARDHYTYGHSERVSDYSAAIAGELGLPPEKVNGIRIAAVLHDIGRVQIPQEILMRPSALTEDERAVVKRHPEYAASILKPLAGMGTVVEDVRHHHEHVDGTGYPAGLAGEHIPIGARIIGVADAFDAMTTDRPYRRAKSVEQAVREIQDGAGSRFDEDIVVVATDILPDLARAGDGRPTFALRAV